MKNIFLVIVGVFSSLFSIYYHGAYQGTEHAATYNGFALMFAIEAILSLVSLLLYRWNVRNRWVNSLFFWTSVLGFPVLLAGLVWAIHFLGSLAH
jgi:hypothetical protein